MRTKLEAMRYFLDKSTIISGGTQVVKREDKVAGAIHEAKMVLSRNNLEMHFVLYCHHDGDLTEDEVLQKFELKGIRLNGEYHDLAWCGVRREGKFYIHPKNWHNDFELRHHPIICGFENCDGYGNVTYATENELLELGFERVPELDWK